MAEEVEVGPGQIHNQFVVMEDLLDKLKLLNYEDGFLRDLGFKPLSRHYFAIPTNPGEQFFIFTSLSAWLINLSGRQMEQPQEYDDPNATISSILDELRQIGATVDFPPSKLKQGCGEHCIYVLDKLSDTALKNTNFKWSRPMYPQEETEEEECQMEDETELTLDKLEGDFIDEQEEDDIEEDGSFLDLAGLQNLQAKTAMKESSKPDNIMESTTNVNDWKLEVERVMPSLKVHIRTDNKDWRTHVDQMHQHRDGIDTALSQTQGHLGKLHDEITKTLEKIGSREKYINNQLENLLQEFRTMQDSLAEAKEQYRQASGGVTDRTKVLAEISEELDKIKMEMEEKGSSMTDGSPLVKVKQALQRLKNEILQMDIRIGTVEHIVLTGKLKDKSNLQKDMNKTLTTSQYDDYKQY
ncbi:intraflagellar transport protein 57 homolog [Anneissia japonica]|uniref:intraflagellar transport protein 57 homolog n=1 Tax=Anneissia japonica TaxID=1529436 RepID=UPI001425B89D|nr:intraflagellar transport protein 57 homolog [Anneissia japonica]XP_033119680.1 intraflagellar transport protein 57 homolog [Anneissia japonica]XP_033119689.1 intraflagellar transport protein 57 homolog [Anneissia japonica]XP_033119698.1 intraflagellar transport protein 57 homolog [Anneissia japonica]